MDYEQKCKDALAHAQTIHRGEEEMKRIKLMFSEFGESEDESVRKELINIINLAYDSGIAITAENRDKYLGWLDKQRPEVSDCQQNHQNTEHHNGCITLIDFNDGEGFYKMHLEYLNKKQVEQIEEIVKVWAKELKMHNENIKACIGMCLTDVNEQKFKDYNTNLKECLDYLEKQGEQEKHQVYETADGDIITYSENDEYKVVKPKFKPGDWITNDMCTWKIEFIEDGLYYQNDGDIECGGDIESIDKEYHLWSIKDVKAGDVLCDYHKSFNNPLIFILKKFEHVNFGLVRPSDYSSYCFLTAGDIQRFKEGTYHHKHNIKPATKEQRDLLFIKMEEAGYDWDADMKELKKIANVEIPFGAKDSELQEATYIIPKGFHAEIDDDKVVIKKDKKPIVCSENDDLSCFESALFTAFSDAWQSYLLGEKVNVKQWAKEQSKELLEAAKEELKGYNWSEEDKRKIDRIYSILSQAADTHAFSTSCRLIGDKECIELQDFLKSLRPQNRWKPSDRQMKALKEACDEHWEPDGLDLLYTLYQDLKKLNE